MLGEPEGLSNWQVGLDDNKRGPLDWLFTNDDTSPLGKGLIDATHSIVWRLDFTEENWFLEARLSCELGSIEYSSGSWDNLATTSVDSISVEGNIQDVESDSSHVFFSHDGLFGGPLESSLH